MCAHVRVLEKKTTHTIGKKAVCVTAEREVTLVCRLTRPNKANMCGSNAEPRDPPTILLGRAHLKYWAKFYLAFFC
jgi:hypothetical protein